MNLSQTSSLELKSTVKLLHGGANALELFLRSQSSPKQALNNSVLLEVRHMASYSRMLNGHHQPPLLTMHTCIG